MTNPKIADKQRIDYIDLLRILAITAVASFHFLYSAIVNHKTPNLLPSPLFEFARYGYLGVELFFMISGYVIIETVQNSNFSNFLKKRFFRLYPMYWIAVILIFAISSLSIWKKSGPLNSNHRAHHLGNLPSNAGLLDSACFYLSNPLGSLGRRRHIPVLFNS